jgi:hypothetical protein
MRQIAFSFDQVTVNKILKGALIAMTGAAALALLDYSGQIQIDNPLLASVIAWLIPTATNIVKEWMAGQK